MKKDFTADAAAIVEAVGGRDNIVNVSHCMTRLRLVLADEDLASDSEVEGVPSVLRVIRQGGQYQVVIGNDVPKVYAALREAGISGNTVTDAVPASPKKANPLSRFFGFVSGCMTPLLPAMLGGGMVKVLVSLLTTLGWLSTAGTTYGVLSVIGDAFFYFLPIMLAYTVADRMGSSKLLAMLVAGVLLHPDLAALFAAGNVTFLGLPVTAATYSSSVLPIFILVPIMKYIEDFADRISPQVIKVFFKPFLVVLISAPLALIVIGPLGTLAGNLLADGISALYNRAGWLTVALLAALMPFVIMTGMHYSLVPLATMSMASLGFDPMIIIAMFCSNLAQGGASFGVAVRTSDKSIRQVATGAGISAVVAGVTEPALYGVTMKYKTPLIAACVGAGAAGVFAALTGTVAYSLGGSPSVFTLVQMIGGDGLTGLVWGLVTLAITLLVSFTLTVILYRESSAEEGRDTEKAGQQPLTEMEAQPASAAVQTRIHSVVSPLTGRVIPLSEVSDETFSSGILGQGCAVLPTDGHVYAPVNGRILSVFDTHHALTMQSEDGLELLIHVGQDTVTLGGRYFTAHRLPGEEVRAGDLILSFDLDAVDKEGYDLTTPIVVTDSFPAQTVTVTEQGNVTAGDPLITVQTGQSFSA